MVRLCGGLLVLAICSFIPAQAEPSQTAVASKPVPAPAEVKSAAAVPHPLEKADLEAFFDGIVPLQLERSDAAGATVLVRKEHTNAPTRLRAPVRARQMAPRF